MNTLALLSGLCVAAASVSATSASDPCCDEKPQPLLSEVRFAPAGLSLAAPQARRVVGQAGQKGMIGVYLAEDGERARVDGLVSGGPAEEAGLEAGDVIVAVDGKPVKGWSALSERLAPRRAGEEVRVTVERDGWRKELSLTLAPAPAPPGGGANAVEAPSSGYFFEAAPQDGQKQERLRVIERKVREQGDGQALFEGSESPLTLRLRRSDDGEGQARSGGAAGRFLLRADAGDGDDEGGACCDACEGCCEGGEEVSADEFRVFGLPGGGQGQIYRVDGGEGKAKVVIKKGDGETRELRFGDGGQGGVHGGQPHVLRWHADGPVEFDMEPFELDFDVHVEHGEEHEHDHDETHEGSDHHQPFVIGRKVEGAPGGVRFFGGGDLKELKGLDVKGLEGMKVWTSEDGAVHTFGWVQSDGDDAEDDDRRATVRRRVLGLGAAPAPPGAPQRPAVGELRELRHQLDELRQELRELRTALRRAQAGAR